jgi:glutathione S-transferase|tara:strand:+ start:4110 stop:4916 length:807 start_codon:yes stop_codon:yes gene_type:complete
MSLELYNFSQSTCSLKVRLQLAEKEITWTDKRLISSDNEHLSDWYLKLNPNGVVPTLLHNGKPIYESTAILEYLEDEFRQKKFRPTDPFLCSQLRAWLIFVDVWPAPAVRTPSFHFGGLLEKFKKMSQEKFEELKEKRPLKKEFYNSFDKNSGFSEKDIFTSFSIFERTFIRMEYLLKEFGGPWLMGKDYTIGDMAILPSIDRMEDLGLDDLWNKRFEGVKHWLKKAQTRPASKIAFYRGSRLSEQFPELNLGRGANSSVVEKYLKSK